jgi:1,4-alpha-glucan branching enzyme
LLDEPGHREIQLLVGELNRLYREHRSLHALDCDPRGFAWVDADDAEHSVIVYERRGEEGDPVIVVALNFTPVPRTGYRVGVPEGGVWEEILNTDALAFGGSGQGNLGAVEAAPVQWHGRPFSLSLTLPPLGGVLLMRRAEAKEEVEL